MVLFTFALYIHSLVMKHNMLLAVRNACVNLLLERCMNVKKLSALT